MIKKLLLIISLAAIFCSCSKQREWSREQRHQMRQDLRTYRDMVYLTDLNDVEWELFADDVAVALENDYPVYATFIEMPSARRRGNSARRNDPPTDQIILHLLG